MLKIKDNVDLKELEKYGLKPLYDCNRYTGETYVRCIVSEKYVCKYGGLTLLPRNEKRGLYIWKPSNRIDNNNKTVPHYFFNDDTFVDLDLLYDLIKANLVEKVEK